MRRSSVRLAVLAASLAALLAPHSSPSQSGDDDFAARTLLATNVAQAMMHPAKGEDTEFFIRTGGVPNVFFLVDSSGSMGRLPPNGPAFYGGSDPTMPPGVVLANPSSAPDVTAAMAAPRTVGCGLDPVSAADPLFAGNEMFLHLGERKFYPPCGNAVHPEVVGKKYGEGRSGLMPNYAEESSVCPYYSPSNSQATGKRGYDPDSYDPNPTAAKVPSTLFVDHLVYHDNVFDHGADGAANRNWARSTLGLNHNFGNGWSARTNPPTGFPYTTSAGGYASIDIFCDEQGTTPLPNGQVPSQVCRQCLRDGVPGTPAAGWYYDGFILERTQEGIANKRYPSLWYTGNYLNFFPPKFMIMKKIVKDVIASQSKVRMALARFGPDGMSFLKDFNPTCAMPDSSFDSNRGTYVNLVNGITFDDLGENGTPLANALFDIGRYYHSPALPWFGGAWEKIGNLWESSANSNDYAVCYACQTSSVIVLTDGLPSPTDGTGLPRGEATATDAASGRYAGDSRTGLLPGASGTGGVSSIDCPQCGAFSGADDYKNNLARVAWYLHNYDLRDNAEATKDCKTNADRQTLDLYTVGYSTRQLGDANTVLANAAAAGGGIFVQAENPLYLKAGINNVFEEINGRSTSFSIATVSTLQTTSGHTVIVPRFDPAKGPFWQGHLYRYELYSEFVNECVPGVTSTSPVPCCEPHGKGDLDCDGRCRSVFLQDANGGGRDPYFIQEGADGLFYQNTPNTASCSQAPRCQAAGKACGDVGTTPAKPWWDAGAELAKKGWKQRNVFTVVDLDSSGQAGTRDRRIDRHDRKIRLDSSKDNDEAAKAILPYLGNKDNRVCATIANRIETAGDAVTATVVRTNEVECAKTVVRWVLGADVFNDAHRKPTDTPPWPPPRPFMDLPATVGNLNTVPRIEPNLPDQEKLGDRPYKLGDIFHSSPVVVDPPLPRTGILCSNGLHNQCLMALWRAPSGDTFSEDDVEYDAYVKEFGRRRKVILVGSNTGLVHAFNGGRWQEGKDDPLTGVDESEWPFEGYFDRGEPDIVGGLWAEELWAFLPPDMIAKIPLIFSGEHQLLADGSAMVRDVWVDGTANGIGAERETTRDDAKQAREFHTVAVFGERRGGLHYFALDVTKATKLPGEEGYDAADPFPGFLWIYPQPDSRESFSFGETYTEFLPAAPPIGPVRIKADAVSGTTNHEPEFRGVKFHERWIAFLSGGHDPNYVRGRGVHMVDVWSGYEYFDFSYPDNSLTGDLPSSDDPRWQLRFPIPATVGMVSWGPGPRREFGLSGYTNQGFFDTATFGDAGGQLWVLRFHEPGELDETTGKVKNWFGARAFQMGGGAASLGWGYPFFYITTNTALPDGYIYRAFIGSGDRFNILDRNGGSCGPDNLRGCAMRGCYVWTHKWADPPELGYTSAWHEELAKGPLTSSAYVYPWSYTAAFETYSYAYASCPSPDPSTAQSWMNKYVPVTCSPDAQSRWGCDHPWTPEFGGDLTLSNTTNVPVSRNWFFSVRIFDDAPNPRIPFRTQDEAVRYDAARLWIRDAGGASITQSGGVGGKFSIISASDLNPVPPANPRDAAGWAIYYDHGPTVTVAAKTLAVNALDERTSSVSALGGRAISWNTMQPASPATAATRGSCFASRCSGDDKRVGYHYAAHPLTGGIAMWDADGNPVRSTTADTFVPAQGDQPTVFLNQKGEVLVAHTAVNPETGASALSASEPVDSVSDLGWIEVSEAVHACRHFVPTDAQQVPPDGVCR